MRVCTYLRQTAIGQFKRLGVFYNQSTIIDINLLWQAHFEDALPFGAKSRAAQIAPVNLSRLLEENENSVSFLQESLELFEKLSKKGQLHTKDKAYFSFDLNDDESVRLLSPIDKINCYRDFYIHEKHVKKGFEKRKEEVPAAWYEMPVYYKGPTTGFIGTGELVQWPSYTKKLDFELELGCVMGKAGKNIKAKDAYDHIFGFTILNDISARDIQKKEMSVRLGPSKGKDFCSVVGPVIVTKDEFGSKDPDLEMIARVNDEQWSKGRSSEGHYSWGEMIEFASKEEWILPTDFMGSGTVGTGCGLELDRWIQSGDILELEIEKIGKLKNIIGTPGEK